MKFLYFLFLLNYLIPFAPQCSSSLDVGSEPILMRRGIFGGDDPDIIHYPSYPGNPPDYSSQLSMENYFSNLCTNFPNNYYGTCGYVALSMVLSYYDTFYNDSIIPNSYDVSDSLSSNNVNASSPGVKHQSSTYFYADHTLKQYVDNTYNECLDSLLIWERHTNSLLPDYDSGLSGLDAATLIDNHYSQFGLFPIFESGSLANNNAHTYGFQYSDLLNDAPMEQTDAGFYNWIVSEAQNKSDELVETVVSFIHQGIPVILSLFNGFVLNPDYMVQGGEWIYNYYLYSGNHVVVAYDTTFINGVEIPLCHFGWDNGLSFPYNSFNYSYIFDAVPIGCNWLTHLHSNNYKINNLLFCGCGHHTHSYSYNYVNEMKHSITCGCGYLNHSNHTDYLYYTCCGGGLDYPPGVLNYEDGE